LQRAVPVPLPAAGDVLLEPPDAAEARLIAGGVAAAIAPDTGLTRLQRYMIEALTESMTGFAIPVTAIPKLGPEAFARVMHRRDAPFRSRMVQFMLLGELVLVPLPPEVVGRVEAYAAELGVDDAILKIARRYATGSLGLALIDFQRSGYMEEWTPASTAHLHTARALDEAWEMRCDEPELAARWAALADCPDGSLGQGIWRFYSARGFSFPGLLQSAPPLSATRGHQIEGESSWGVGSRTC